MRTILLYIIIILSPLMAISSYAQDFEGQITLKHSNSQGQSFLLQWYIKGDQVAYDIIDADTRLRVIPQISKKNLLLIAKTSNEEHRTNIAVDEIKPSLGINFNDVRVNSLGQNRSSYSSSNSETLIIRDKETTTTLNITRDIPIDLGKYAAYFKADYIAFALKKAKIKGFPVSSISKDKEGKILSKTELIEIKRKTISDEYFK